MALRVTGPDPTVALVTTQMFARAVVSISAAILLFSLYRYGTHVLTARGLRRNVIYFAIGTGAAFIYGITGIMAIPFSNPWLPVLSEGATLFFIMFYALGFRAFYFSAPNINRDHHSDRVPRSVLRQYLPIWLDYVIIASYIVGWWATVLVIPEGTAIIVAVGWVLASAWALVWAILIVSRHEGTSLASLTRHLFPAIVAFTVTILSDLWGRNVPGWDHIVTATWIVGTVFLGGFFLSTAIALRQESGEVERIYDWTTHRSDRFSGDDPEP
ncbi:MAG: hypothetical protein ABEJ58_04920 [Halodesulfurarchaeum sp.]